MIRFYHRLLKMNTNRLTKKVYEWDRSFPEEISTWSKEVKSIFNESNLTQYFDSNSLFNLEEILNLLKKSFLIKQSNYLRIECALKPKLRTFLLFKDFDKEPAYIYKPITFFQRRILAKMRLGCLPLRLETGRYQIPRLAEEDRSCQVCEAYQLQEDVKPIESEVHFMLYCPVYQTLRETWFKDLSAPVHFFELLDSEKLRIALNNPENVKTTATFLISALNMRSTKINSMPS